MKAEPEHICPYCGKKFYSYNYSSRSGYLDHYMLYASCAATHEAENPDEDVRWICLADKQTEVRDIPDIRERLACYRHWPLVADGDKDYVTEKCERLIAKCQEYADKAQDIIENMSMLERYVLSKAIDVSYPYGDPQPLDSDGKMWE